MPVRQATISCPNCRQPTVVGLEQVFNLHEDPEAKQRLLSGQSNMVRCQGCGFQGPYATPVVYHDPEKEMLLTFVPPELGLGRDDQERVVGRMITEVVNALPMELRKAYLLRPRTMLTFQTLLETVLEGDGVTKEMIQAQQARLTLLQRLANISSEDTLIEAIKAEDALIDQEFMLLFGRIMENAIAQGDQGAAQQLSLLQEMILAHASYGRAVQAQTQEIEAAMGALQAIGNQLTRDKLLDLIEEAPNEDRIRAYVNLIRQGMDYQFFQLLSQRIDRASGEARTRLSTIRQHLLEWTQEVDQMREAQQKQARQFLDALLASDNLPEMLVQNFSLVNDPFVHVLQEELESAQKANDPARMAKLQEMVMVLQQMSTPPEMALINDLMEAPDAQTRARILQENAAQVTDELTEALTGIIAQMDEQGDPETAAQVKVVYQQVLRFSMKAKMGKRT